MFAFLMTLFVIVVLILAGFILIQQGKGDMGLGSLGGGTQMLFGGSGGQEFFEKATWILGAIFIFGSLGLAVLKTKEHRETSLSGYSSKKVLQKFEKKPLSKKDNERGKEQ
jgi:protein translocase SecG subunit